MWGKERKQAAPKLIGHLLYDILKSTTTLPKYYKRYCTKIIIL